MPVSRMRMRPWLESMIESQRISGLKWLDSNKTMFSIPWKHAARHGWEMDKDACLFKEWALHTGKYVEGQNTDPKTWKANFRCAMNSLPDVEEVKDRSINKGHQAVRVFRMLPATQKSRDKRSKSKEKTTRKMIKMETETDDSSDADSCTDALVQVSNTQENNIDSTVCFERTDSEFMAPELVPDWSLSVEIGPENDFTNFCHRFEVSPDHSPEYSDIIELCQQLEKDTQFPSSSSDRTGFLYNESCTDSESPWSDCSSDEPEGSPRYLNLGTESNFQDDVWKKNLFASFDW